MKTLKKSIFAIAFILISSGLFAQKYSIKAGLNMADMSVSNNTGALDQFNEMKSGVHVGFFYEKVSSSLFTIETGLLFDQKGLKYILQTGSVTQTNIMNLYSLNLPVNLKIGFDLSEKIRLFGKLGGYGGLNISGKIQSEISNSGNIQSDVTNDLNIGNNTSSDDIKPIDFGAQVGLGVQYKSFLFEVMYDKGLANLATNQVLDDVMQNKNLRFSVGYQFGN
ncbi:MAG TPA: PorT family protein [Lutibacter sp.]|nr:PorT family protein [Lutibacter sp.]